MRVPTVLNVLSLNLQVKFDYNFEILESFYVNSGHFTMIILWTVLKMVIVFTMMKIFRHFIRHVMNIDMFHHWLFNGHWYRHKFISNLLLDNVFLLAALEIYKIVDLNHLEMYLGENTRVLVRYFILTKISRRNFFFELMLLHWIYTWLILVAF